MSYQTEGDLAARVVTGQIERVVAARELAEMGIENASPADCEWWLSFTPRQRRHATLAWLILKPRYN